MRMILHQVLEHFLTEKKIRNVLLLCMGIAFALNIVFDYWESLSRGTSFYISESLIFSSFWLVFFPLVHIQVFLMDRIDQRQYMACLAAVMMAVHVFVYPLVVWMISRVCYEHTFAYWQTFTFGLSEHSIKLLIAYPLSMVSYQLYRNETGTSRKAEPARPPAQAYMTSILVQDHAEGNLVLDTQDIWAFSANPPYINIIHRSRKYLLTGTLRSLENQLDGRAFVRIHKSHIINLRAVTVYKSRGNGDYDLTLSDGSVWRLSRNYAKHFLVRLEAYHRLAST